MNRDKVIKPRHKPLTRYNLIILANVEVATPVGPNTLVANVCGSRSICRENDSCEYASLPRRIVRLQELKCYHGYPSFYRRRRRLGHCNFGV
jgi:hypothetical protein